MLEANDGFLQLWQAYCDKKSEVEDLKEQRAELLEALKEMWDAHEHNTSGRLSVMVIEAITRAAAQMQLDKEKA